VDDTPTQQSANRGCPSGEKHTAATPLNGDMYMNYMDFTDDALYVLCSAPAQRLRMRALFAPGGPRNKLLSSTALTATR